MVVEDALNGHLQVATLQESNTPHVINLPQVTPALIWGEEAGHRRAMQAVGLMDPIASPTMRLLGPTVAPQYLVIHPSCHTRVSSGRRKLTHMATRKGQR